MAGQATAEALQYLPGHQMLFPLDPEGRVAWIHAHDLWRLAAAAAILALIVLSPDPGRARIRKPRRTPPGRHRPARGRAA